VHVQGSYLSQEKTRALLKQHCGSEGGIDSAIERALRYSPLVNTDLLSLSLELEMQQKRPLGKRGVSCVM
jgi:hypothetical protein